jgi:hypothetical protein
MNSKMPVSNRVYIFFVVAEWINKEKGIDLINSISAVTFPHYFATQNTLKQNAIAVGL